MKLRHFKVEDFISISKWYREWGQKAIPIEFFPRNGLIISNQGVDVAALFVYATDSNICMVENLITNKNYKEKNRSILIDLLFREVFKLAKSLGFEHAMSVTKNSFVKNRLSKRHNYKLTDLELFIKEL